MVIITCLYIIKKDTEKIIKIIKNTQNNKQLNYISWDIKKMMWNVGQFSFSSFTDEGGKSVQNKKN